MLTNSFKKYVTSGPHLWVATLLHHKGPLSTKGIWQQYLKDSEVEEGLIKSKSHLRNQILRLMHIQKKLFRAPAQDLRTQFKRSGWRVYRVKAFRNTDPEILAKMDPIPPLRRKDLRKYCQIHKIEFYSGIQVKRRLQEERKDYIKYVETYIHKKTK